MFDLKKFGVYDYILAMLLILLGYNMLSVGYAKVLGHAAPVLFTGMVSDFILKWILTGKGFATKSTIATSLIVSIIIGPGGFEAVIAVLLAMLSKNLLRFEGRHFLNPANFGVLATVLLLPTTAQSWWAAEPAWLVLLLGLIVAYKLNRWIVPAAFLVSYGVFGILFDISSGFSLTPIFSLYSGLTLFFALVMVSEPMTMPLRRNSRIVFGALVGLFSVLLVHIFPSIALLGALALGNLLVPALNTYVK